MVSWTSYASSAILHIPPFVLSCTLFSKCSCQKISRCSMWKVRGLIRSSDRVSHAVRWEIATGKGRRFGVVWRSLEMLICMAAGTMFSAWHRLLKHQRPKRRLGTESVDMDYWYRCQVYLSQLWFSHLAVVEKTINPKPGGYGMILAPKLWPIHSSVQVACYWQEGIERCRGRTLTDGTEGCPGSKPTAWLMLYGNAMLVCLKMEEIAQIVILRGKMMPDARVGFESLTQPQAMPTHPLGDVGVLPGFTRCRVQMIWNRQPDR